MLKIIDTPKKIQGQLWFGFFLVVTNTTTIKGDHASSTMNKSLTMQFSVQLTFARRLLLSFSMYDDKGNFQMNRMFSFFAKRKKKKKERKKERKEGRN